MSTETNKAILEQFNQAMGQFWQTGDTSVFDMLVAENAIFLIERWGQWDQLGTMQQLGVIPQQEQ